MTATAQKSSGSSPASRRAPVPGSGWRLLAGIAVLGAFLSVAAWFAPAAVARWIPPKKREAATWIEAAATARHWAPVGLAVCLAVFALAVAAGAAGRRRRRNRLAGVVALGPSSWGRLPIAVRAVLTVAVAGGAAVAVLYLADPAGTMSWALPASLAAGAAVALALGWWLAQVVALGPHRREWVEPLHTVLAPLLNLPPGTKAAQYLRVPPRYADMAGEVVRVNVPPTWSGANGQGQQIETAVTSKLGLSDVSFRWHLAGRASYLTAVAAPRPPAVARFADPAVRDLIKAAPESAPVIGVSPGRRGVGVDLDAESPHILISAGTGGGKSVMLRTIFAQLLHNGGVGSVLDIKRHSHKWV